MRYENITKENRELREKLQLQHTEYENLSKDRTQLMASLQGLIEKT
jgi:hypothetical protein